MPPAEGDGGPPLDGAPPAGEAPCSAPTGCSVACTAPQVCNPFADQCVLLASTRRYDFDGPLDDTFISQVKSGDSFGSGVPVSGGRLVLDVQTDNGAMTCSGSSDDDEAELQLANPIATRANPLVLTFELSVPDGIPPNGYVNVVRLADDPPGGLEVAVGFTGANREVFASNGAEAFPGGQEFFDTREWACVRFGVHPTTNEYFLGVGDTAFVGDLVPAWSYVGRIDIGLLELQCGIDAEQRLYFDNLQLDELPSL